MSTGSSGGWVSRHSMISDSGWDMIMGDGIILIWSFISIDNITHCLQVHMNVLLFVLIKCQTNDFSYSDTLLISL